MTHDWISHAIEHHSDDVCRRPGCEAKGWRRLVDGKWRWRQTDGPKECEGKK